MRNIKIIYQYDGSSFYGFQRQPKKRTVQGEIEKILNILLNEKIDLISSGRTDRGVHAFCQVSNFQTSSVIPLEKLKFALKKGVVQDIKIIDVEEVHKSFNARFDAKSRGYKYIISSEKNPFRSRYETFIKEKINIARLQDILSTFVGIHDFNNFRLSDCGSKTSIREIYSINITKLDEYRLEITFLGNAFLKSQIRIMVGTALDIYFENRDENIIYDMLENPKKRFIKKVAPPFGLYLSEVNY